MITLEVRMCPFNGPAVKLTKIVPVDYAPQLGSYIVDSGYKFRVSGVELDIKSLMNTVYLADFKAAKVPLEEAIKELGASGWGYKTETTKTKDVD